MQFFHLAVTFLLAVLAGMGVGSGGLYIIWLTSAMGLSAEQGAAGNLMFFIAALLSAFMMNLRRHRIDLAFLFRILLFGLPGAWLGSLLLPMLPEDILHIALGVFLIASGIFSLFLQHKEKKKTQSSER